MKAVILVCIFFLIHHAPTTLAYKAGVFEHYPLTLSTPQDTILKNLNEYRAYTEKAKGQSVDIVVFPEYGLTGIVSDPEEYAIEINDANDVIKETKAIAEEHQMYLVVNLLEKVQETNKATKYYNTNLVFGKNGEIILKYRKINLYNETNLTPGDPNQSLTFSTDFGVTFGIFTCFDILFDNPSRRVLHNIDVTDIVYPTAWISTMPFLTSLTVQHGYSVANGVNLLAANYGQPKNGIGGSGIYLASGQVSEIYISDSASSKPLIQNVPQITKRQDKTICPRIVPFGLPDTSGQSNVTNYVTVRDFEPSKYKFKDVDFTQKNSTYDICDGDFCCKFDITISLDSTGTITDHYKVMAFDGLLTRDGKTHHMRVCSLVACESDSTDSCGNRLDHIQLNFTKLTVKADVKNEEGTFYVPMTLDTYLLPIRAASYCNEDNSTSSTHIELSTTATLGNVAVFGLFGKTASAGVSIHAFGVLFLVLIAIAKAVVF